jgi:hypothetical protein
MRIPANLLKPSVDCLMRNLEAKGKVRDHGAVLHRRADQPLQTPQADVETRQASLRSLAAIACDLPDGASQC